MQKVKTILIDDEEKNNELLKIFIEKNHPFIDVVKVETRVDDAVESIDKLKPSLIFLDIILDEGTGFDILNRITHQDFVLVFVTAFQEYALTAFKFNAIDFILKPVSVSDLFVAIEKVK